MREQRNRLAAEIAAALTEDDIPPSDQAAGAFLVAGLYLHHLVARQLPMTEEELPRIRRQVPRSLRTMLELHLAQLGGTWLRPVLAGLAHAKYPGIPSSLLGSVAAVLAIDQVSSIPPPPSDQELADVLDTVGFYLRRSVDTDGTTLYRLFHEGLAEYLRQHPFVAADGSI
jgi:hypothetical protein